MEPELVVEVGIDVARDASGRWRHPARLHRGRPVREVGDQVGKDAWAAGRGSRTGSSRLRQHSPPAIRSTVASAVTAAVPPAIWLTRSGLSAHASAIRLKGIPASWAMAKTTRRMCFFSTPTTRS
ncbi:hypothetical protein ACWEWI_35880 [Streptomyces sp. NPDC003753]|uniref:hypothetical protein n=1 Tax=Streptomyces sp. Y2F8-2 TaxID=2759675 RepID=UPI001A3CF69F|nr:hypothetical protein [Streptomyces sp. Y2F8-2]GHK01792.1 hypothetical protein SY2F82_35890 [Streptomyces sp. Y2F8-2]